MNGKEQQKPNSIICRFSHLKKERQTSIALPEKVIDAAIFDSISIQSACIHLSFFVSITHPPFFSISLSLTFHSFIVIAVSFLCRETIKNKDNL